MAEAAEARGLESKGECPDGVLRSSSCSGLLWPGLAKARRAMWVELDSLFEVECRVQGQGDVAVREDLLDDVL